MLSKKVTVEASLEDYISCSSERQFNFLEKLRKDDSFIGVESLEPTYNEDGSFKSVDIVYY